MLPMKMKYVIAVLFSAYSSLVNADVLMFGSGPNQFAMDFVTVGNPGNTGDTRLSSRGAVGYTFQMGKYEVSEDMITKYNSEFGIANGLGITIDNRGANKPATSVSWNEAARFVNWLNTSSGGSPAYKFATSGFNDKIFPWTPTDALDYDPSNPFRSMRSNYVLPSFDEWHKSAFYIPLAGVYSDYVNSFTVPTSVASGTTPNTAVFGQLLPADINLAGGLSAYGVMGLGGNAKEIIETEFSFVNDNGDDIRNVRGGSWNTGPNDLLWSNRQGTLPTTQGNRTRLT